ncbi:MAG: thioredoxin-disulfide reductase [Treponemataceae bacterium]|nr:thioredoxin-disulfide reductase [Treponemataceae bacterium]
METTVTHDLIIIGAGPAGLAAAQYGARAELNVLVIENAGAGGQVQNIVTLENYPGVFPGVPGTDFIKTMKEQAEHFGAHFTTETIQSIDKKGEVFHITTTKASYTSYTVLIATGAEHRRLGAKGERELEGAGVSYCATCDGPFFKNRNIIVVGGGDAACDEATYLSTLSPHVTLVHRKGQFRAQKAVAERVLNNPGITVLFNTTVEEIKGAGRVQSVILKNTETGTVTEQSADAVFIFVGMLPRTDLVDMLPKDENGYIKTDDTMATLVPGMYCAGDLRSKSFRQVVTAVADGAIAANSAGQYIRKIKHDEYR